MNNQALAHKSKSNSGYVDQAVGCEAITPDTIVSCSTGTTTIPYNLLVHEVDQSIARLHLHLEESLATELENAVKDVAKVFGISLQNLLATVDIKMLKRTSTDPTVSSLTKLGIRKFQFSLNFDKESALSRRHKIVLFRTAMQRNETLSSIYSDLNTPVEFMLDQLVFKLNRVNSRGTSD